MKKIIKFGVLAAVLVLVSGCGGSKGKVLKCTLSESEDNMNVNMTIKVNYDEEKATKATIENDVKFGKELKDYADELKESYDEQFEELADKEGVEYTSSAKDGKVNYKVSIDVNKISEEVLKDMHMSDLNKTYEETKAALEKDGYSCK